MKFLRVRLVVGNSRNNINFSYPVKDAQYGKRFNSEDIFCFVLRVTRRNDKANIYKLILYSRTHIEENCFAKYLP